MKTPRPRLPWFVLLSALTVLGARPASSDQVSLVADVNHDVPLPWETWAAPPLPRYVELGGALYFMHDDGIHGVELWRTDGTAGGTHLVKDICPGVCGSEDRLAYATLAVAGGAVFLTANDGAHGGELWRSDGTAAGTVMVADISPGFTGGRPTMLTDVGGTLYFWADDGVAGPELWRSDGTAGGTVLVADLVPGPEGLRAWTAAAVGGVLVFSYPSASDLWASDGTAIGTQVIADVQPWQQSFFRGAPFSVLPNGLLLFWGSTVADGGELWRSDGTAAGTSMLIDLWPGSDGSSPRAFEVVGNELYFLANTGAGPTALWRSDGTAPGTQQVALPPDASLTTIPGTLMAAGSRLVFFASDPLHGVEPWATDGVSTTLLADIVPGPTGSFEGWGSWPYGLTVGVSGRAVFALDDGVHGTELWTSDGTPAGTQLLTELAPGSASVKLDLYQSVALPALLADDLYFRDFSTAFGHRLWRTDGTPAGPQLVEVVNQQTSAHRSREPGLEPFGPAPPACLTAAAGRLLFGADDTAHGWELWTSDGTEVGTSLLADLALPPHPYEIAEQRRCHAIDRHGLVEVFAGDPYHGTLWSVGVPGGAAEALVEPFESWEAGTATARFGGELHLLDSRGSLVRSDGTFPGTETLVTAFPDATGPPEVTTAAGRLFLTVGWKLAWSDGSPGSATMVAYDGVDLESTFALGRVGNAVIFAGTHPGLPDDLWRTDGTVAGTLPLGDLRPGDGEPPIERLWTEDPRLAVTADRYFFVANDGVHGEELWASDGTPEGTVMVKDLGPGPYPSSPRDLTAFDGKVFFVAEATGLGRELWVSDGTENGTVLVADIVPGEGSSLPQNLTVADGKLYFSAWDPLHGREAWRVLPAPVPPPGLATGSHAPSGSEPLPAASVSGTAPTPPSIERLPDIALGARSSSPLRFASVGGTTYTLANDNVRGFELWKIEEAGLIFRDGFESEDAEHWSGVAP